MFIFMLYGMVAIGSILGLKAATLVTMHCLLLYVVGTSVYLHAVRNGSDLQHPWAEGSHTCNDALLTHVRRGTIAGKVSRMGHEHHASVDDHPRPVLSLAHGMCCLQLILFC